MVGGGFNKQGNLYTRLVLGGHKTGGSPHPPARILKVYLTTFSLVFSPDGLNNTLLSPDYGLETAPSVGMVGRMYISRTGGNEEPPTSCVQLEGQPVVTSSS